MVEDAETQGPDRIFDRETLLDLTVNFIPLGIILFFLLLFTVYQPFAPDLVATVIMIGLHVIPFASLAILTYFAGKVITEAERTGASDTAETVAEATIGMGEGETDEGGDSSDQPSTGQQSTGAPAGASSDRAQRTSSDDEEGENGEINGDGSSVENETNAGKDEEAGDTNADEAPTSSEPDESG